MLQLHYTSCRRGLRGSAGFQFRTVSLGVAPEDLVEIERIAVYSVSRDLDMNASVEDVARSFPILFRFRVLESGRWAILRSNYVGCDYSGRTGNYFAHALVADPRTWDLWPVEFFEWEGWVDRLPPEQDTPDEPAPLPVVKSTAVRPAASFSTTELQSFLTEIPSRRRVLEQMIKALFARTSTSRTVLIRDSYLNGLYWIACLQKSFLPSLFPRISFSSYQFDQRDCEAINVSVGETGFAFDDTMRRFQFFVFDQQAGQYSDVPSEGGDYAAAVVKWLVESPATLDSFHDFGRVLDHLALDPDLINAVHLYCVERGLAAPGGAPGLRDLVEFCGRHAAHAGRTRLAAVVARMLTGPAAAVDPEGAALAAEFLGLAARETNDPEVRSMAYQAWLGLFESFLKGSLGKDCVEDSLRRLDGHLGAFRSDLARLFLCDRQLDIFARCFGQATPEALLVLIDHTFAAHRQLGLGPNWHETMQADFLAGILELARDPMPLASRLFAPLVGSPEALTQACRLMTKTVISERGSHDRGQAIVTIGRALGRALAQMPYEQAGKIRAQFDAPETHAILAGDFLESVVDSQGPDRKDAFRRYRDGVLPYIPAFAQTQSGWLQEAYVRSLPPDEALLEIENVLGRDTSGFSPEFIGWCVERLNGSIPLTLQDAAADRRGALILDGCHRYHLQMLPDRALLRRTLLGLGATGPEIGEPSLHAHLGALPAPDYRLFAASYLARAYCASPAVAVHGDVLGRIVVDTHADVFVAAYVAWLDALSRQRDLNTLALVVRFWLVEPRAGAAPSLLARMRPAVLDALGSVLAVRSDLVKRLDGEYGASGVPPTIGEAWNGLRARAQRNSKLSGKVRNLFGGRKQ